MISVTITDRSGRTLSGQTIEAFWASIAHSEALSVGINCALGADEMRPSRRKRCPTMRQRPSSSCYPNAGLPNAMGEYDETPERTAQLLAEFARDGFVNVRSVVAAARHRITSRRSTKRPRRWIRAS